MKRTAIAFATIVLASCGIQTRTVRLDPLQVPSIGLSPKPRALVVIAEDARDLTQAPSSMGSSATPSFLKAIGPSDAASLIAGVGDGSKGFAIVLPGGETVAHFMQRFVASLFEGRGYAVYLTTQGHPGAIVANVSVTQFYLNQPFNFLRALTWTQQMKASIATDITVKDGSSERTYLVAGHGANIVQTNKDENYQQTYSTAMKDYIKDFNAKVPADP